MKNAMAITLLLLACFTTLFAQDLVSVAPNAAKVAYEDARVRVVHLKIAPHEVLPMHDRPQRVVVTLTANDVRLTTPDGKEHTTQVPAGNIAWARSGKRSVRNLDIPVENFTIELKDAAEPAVPVAQPPSPDDPRALVEKHHRWLFENQYVRVYDVHVPPGEMTDFHTHDYNTIVIQMSGGVTASQPQNGKWGKDETSQPATVEYLADAHKHRVHRVRNDGKQEFHVVLIQFMH